MKIHQEDNENREFITHSNMNGFQTFAFQGLSDSKTKRRFQLSAISNLLRTYNKKLSDTCMKFLVKARLNLLGNAIYKHIYNIRNQGECPRYNCNEQEWT